MPAYLKALSFIVCLMFYNAKGKSLSIRNAGDGYHKSYCEVDGTIFNTGERIPRRHPCHICICMEGVAQCAWQDCPLPPEGCSVIEVQNMCNPSLYLCKIPDSVKETGKWNRIVRRNSDVKPEKLDENAADCTILGVPYKTGSVIGVASHNCLECRCGKQDLYCSPRCCFRVSNLLDTPGQILKALKIGLKLPSMHPLHYLTHN